MDDGELLRRAESARRFAYAPYSRFTVGAALLAESGKIYTGCNIESASYTPTVCAERTAFFKAVSEGERRFLRIAIAGGAQGRPAEEPCPPCGVCRQVMMEFCDPHAFQIVLASGGKPRRYLLEELLPVGFGPGNLRGTGGKGEP